MDRLLNQQCGYPVTRHEWAAWLARNIHEFRERMKTAFIDRRKRNRRLTARTDLPSGVPRLQPRRHVGRLQASWAVNLAGRGGWHGVLLTSGTYQLFFLVRHDRNTFVIDLEPSRVHGQCVYELDQSFDLAARLKPLSSLDEEMPEVNAAYSFEIEATPLEHSGGIRIRPSRFSVIKEPLPRKKQGDIGDDAEVQDDIGDAIDSACSDDDDARSMIEV